MSALAPAKAPEPSSRNPQPGQPNEPPTSGNFPIRLETWKQVVIAELLNLMEGRRYDNLP